MTPETTGGWIDIFTEQGFMKLLAIQGFILPMLFIWGAYRAVVHGINKLADPLRRLADHMDEVDKS